MQNKNQKEKDKEIEVELVQIPKTELDKLKNELESQKDRYLRLQAEFDNARKRMQREQQEFIKYANEGILLDFLQILDDLERSVSAIEQKHEDAQAFLKGIEMILSHIYEMLKRYNVKPIEAKGLTFDPNAHEALMQVEDGDFPENTIVEELQKGYLLGERILRTSKVKVSKKPDVRRQTTENRGQNKNHD